MYPAGTSAGQLGTHGHMHAMHTYVPCSIYMCIRQLWLHQACCRTELLFDGHAVIEAHEIVSQKQMQDH